MSRRFPFTVLLILSTLWATKGIAQSNACQDALLSFAQKLDGGAYTFEITQTSFPSERLITDTVTVFFYHDPTSDALHFFCRSRGKITSYINGKYGITDLAKHTFKYTLVKEEQAINRAAGLLIKTFVTRGKILKTLLGKPKTQIAVADTTTKEGTFHGFLLRNSYPFLPDTTVHNLYAAYYIDKDSILRYVVDSSTIFRTTFRHELKLLKWSFSKETIGTITEELQNYHHALDSLGYQMIEESSLLNEQPKLLEVGTKAPPITGITTEGGKLDVQKIPAKLYLLEFSFAGCEPCLRMAEPLERIYKEYGNNGLAVISLDPMDDLTIIKDLSERLNTTYLHLQIPPETAENYHVSGYPTIYLLDSDFRVIIPSQGFRFNIEICVKEKIESNLNKKDDSFILNR